MRCVLTSKKPGWALWVRRVSKGFLEISGMLTRKNTLFKRDNMLSRKSGFTEKISCAPLETPFMRGSLL